MTIPSQRKGFFKHCRLTSGAPPKRTATAGTVIDLCSIFEHYSADYGFVQGTSEKSPVSLKQHREFFCTRGMTTTMALKHLTTRRARQVWLVKPGHFGALVTFDHQRNELIIRNATSPKPLTLNEVLFETRPVSVI